MGGTSIDKAQAARLIQAQRQARADTDRFQARFPPAAAETPMPAFTWEALERQLLELAETSAQAEAARHLVSATRKLSPGLPAELVLRRVLILAACVQDDGFPAGSDGGEIAMI